MRLMISIVSGAEANKAIQGGADILDIKNPSEGSLGAQSPKILRDIVAIADGDIAVSAAIGDMPYLPGTASLAAFGAATCGVDYVKVGLHGPRTETDAVILLREIQAAVQDFDTALIAAAYADFQRAGTLNPRCLPRVAALAGVKGCLMDTAIKDGLRLFDFLSPLELRRLIEETHEAGMLFGLAGALSIHDLPLVRELGADIAGFRSAVCRDAQRNGPLDISRVQQLHRLILN